MTRENELVDLLKTEEIDVIFITETDVRRGNVSSYKIAGFTTQLQTCNSDEDQVRVVALVKEDLCLNLKLREDLMNTAFPSIWLEIQDTFKSPTLIGGFYRQWSNGTKLTIPEQVEEIEIFCDQICRANSQTNCKLVITGDANLCADSWEEDDYDRKSTSQPLLRCLELNGIQVQKVGATYQADHMSKNGSVAQSALDHVYTSESIKECIKIEKIKNSSSDHLPVVINYSLDLKKIRHKFSVTKRSFKNFTKEGWNRCLAEQEWLDVDDCEDVNQMVNMFNDNIERALDQIAPVKTFQIRSSHRLGLSDSTKELMQKGTKQELPFQRQMDKKRGFSSISTKNYETR